MNIFVRFMYARYSSGKHVIIVFSSALAPKRKYAPKKMSGTTHHTLCAIADPSAASHTPA